MNDKKTGIILIEKTFSISIGLQKKSPDIFSYYVIPEMVLKWKSIPRYIR